MYRVEQVLIPVDFSSFSRSALAFVRNLAEPVEDEGKPRLVLAHAAAQMPPYLRRILFPYAALGEDDREFEAEIVEAATTELFRYFAIDEDFEKRFLAEPAVEFGAPREMIKRWAGQFSVDLIAMGAFGENGAVPGRLGSTAERIVRSSTQPVALIRDHDTRPRIRKILVAVDLSKQTPEVLRVATGLALQQNAELDLVHVLASPLLYDTNGLLAQELKYDESKTLDSMRPKIDALFERAVESVEFPFAYREKAQSILQTLMVRSGDPAAEIAETAYEGSYDLVVVGTNSRQGRGAKSSLGRVASSVIGEVSTHLLVVPSVQTQTPLVEMDQ